MQDLLAGLAYQRIAAVDGKTLEGPEQTDFPGQGLTRHWTGIIEVVSLVTAQHGRNFWPVPDSYCCILEDDIYISDDFPKFVKDSAWIPKNCKLLKIETIEQPVIISRKTTTCLNRTSAFLYSLDFGTAAYIVSREGAQILLNETARPRFAIDIIVYSKNGRRKLKPSLLFPALCIQAKRHKAGEGNYFC